MKLTFNKIIIKNFGSYGEATLNLKDHGYCLVSGKNNCPKDNAANNGSGKSSCFNAIVFTLCGITMNEVKTNLKNINIDEDLAYTTLDFNVDDINYVITRYLAPKADLKIIKNGADISGKGIKESTVILNNELPDLNYNYLSNVVILGQGMPNKFSSLSPVNKKQRLEELTKSDFMIEDIKTRISNRQTKLNENLRSYEDNLLINGTQLNTIKSNLDAATKELSSLVKPDYDTEINNLTKHLESINKNIKKTDDNLKTITEELEKNNKAYLNAVTLKNSKNEAELAAYNSAYNEKNGNKIKLTSDYNNLEKEIKRLKSITDVCPTCGQKLQGVKKPDTTEKEKELANLKLKITEADRSLNECLNAHEGYQKDILEEFNTNTNDISKKITELKSLESRARDDINDYSQYASEDKEKITKLTVEKSNWDSRIKNLNAAIEKYQKEQLVISNQIKLLEASRQETLDRLAVVKKMETLVKRDFRGYLLTNIITYLDKKAKEYSKIVFGTEELDIKLNGNSIDISYCNKNIENLSGGERSRCDIILQLAIRDLMSDYFNYTSNIIVLDEITDYLDATSCAAAMNLLSNSLKTVDSVFIISHHAESLDIPVDSEILVEKDINGISTLTEN